MEAVKLWTYAQNTERRNPYVRFRLVQDSRNYIPEGRFYVLQTNKESQVISNIITKFCLESEFILQLLQLFTIAILTI